MTDDLVHVDVMLNYTHALRSQHSSHMYGDRANNTISKHSLKYKIREIKVPAKYE